MTKQYIDSNVFFYAKIRDRVYGSACSTILRKIVSGELEAATSALVLVEVANAMRKYGFESEVAKEVRAICSLRIDLCAIDASDVQEATDIYEEVEISPYDCLHAAVMRRYGLKEIVSADKDFDRIKWLKRLDPRSSAATP